MNIQKKMIRQRAEEQADRKVGEYYDVGIMLGIKFAKKTNAYTAL